MANKLLKQVEKLIVDDKKRRKEKGEDFNIFSILRMETKETITHSAFLAALLEPKGDHYQNAIFLELFLNKIGYLNTEKVSEKDREPSLEKAKVTVEFYLGPIEEKAITGGRIDILIQLGQNYVSIENKNNTVYYLTLDGKQPDSKNFKNKKFDQYLCISYQKHIREWIEECLNHTKEHSILNASIKQYLILIKKITGQMDDELQPKLLESITENLESAKAVYLNFNAALNKIRHDFRKEVETALKPLAEDAKLEIKQGNKIQDAYAGLWITPDNNPDCNVFMGLESFNGTGNDNGNGNLMCGIGVHNGDEKIAYKINPGFKNDKTVSKYWPIIDYFETSEKFQKLQMGEINQLQKLLNDKARKEQIDIIKKQFKKYIPIYKKNLENLKNHL